MQRFNVIFLLSLMVGCICLLVLKADERATKYGHGIPVDEDLHVLKIFAQVDDEKCNYDSGNPDLWPDGELPVTAPNIFDSEKYPLGTSEGPQSHLSRFYYDMSFGEHYITGDYLDHVIEVPCDIVLNGDDWSKSYIWNYLDSVFNHRHAQDTSPFYHGSDFEDFDNFTNMGFDEEDFAGKEKTMQPDGSLDMIMVLWREHENIASIGQINSGTAGAAIMPNRLRMGKESIGPYFTKTNTEAGFGINKGDTSDFEFIIQEYMHAMYGGNLWHSAGGAGNHTFAVRPRSYGLTAQHQTMFAVSGWDRHHLSWKNPGKTYVTSALDEQGNEVSTDSLSVHKMLKVSYF